MSLSKSEREVHQLDSIKELLPPFTYHLYIGHSFRDVPLVTHNQDSLQNILDRDYGISCYPRHEAGDRSVKERIDEGVAECQKCLLVMTQNYFDDDYSNYEIQTIHRKGKRFSKDMIIVLWLDSELQKAKLSNFKEYNNILLSLNDLKNPEFLLPLVQTIKKSLNAQLTCLPKENVGYGAAMGYFYGFLRLVLPNFRKRFDDAIAANPSSVSNMKDRSVKKMLIILPRTCFCNVRLESGGRITNVVNFYVKLIASRAGNVKRVYNSSVFQLTDPSPASAGEAEYYFAGELATPLLTMFESYYFGMIGMTKEQLYEERNAFCYTLYHILQNPENAVCNDEYRLVMWNDEKDSNGEYKTELHTILLPIVKEELKKEKELSKKLFSDSANVSHNSTAASEKSAAYEIVEDGIQNMAASYEKRQFNCYELREEGIRGQALIINIQKFTSLDKSTKPFDKRLGAEVDQKNMANLFKLLGFVVAVYVDVDNAELERVLMKYNSMDHSDSDAFICCIMTHGNLGQIYTSDCKPYNILSVVDMFTPDKCETLRGKPKIFFLQSCQNVPESDKSDDGNNPVNENIITGLEIDMVPFGSTGASNPNSVLTEYNESGANSTIDGNVANMPNDANMPNEANVPNEANNPNEANMPNETNMPNEANMPNVSQARQVSERCAALCSLCHKNVSCSNAECQSNLYVDDLQNVTEINMNNSSSSVKFLKDEVRATLVPGVPDILMSYSALPGSSSNRDIYEGSLYIQALAEQLPKHQEIDRALKNVTEYVKDKLKNEYEVDDEQLPFHLTTGMSKLLFLTPVLNN